MTMNQLLIDKDVHQPLVVVEPIEAETPRELASTCSPSSSSSSPSYLIPGLLLLKSDSSSGYQLQQTLMIGRGEGPGLGLVGQQLAPFTFLPTIQPQDSQPQTFIISTPQQLASEPNEQQVVVIQEKSCPLSCPPDSLQDNPHPHPRLPDQSPGESSLEQTQEETNETKEMPKSNKVTCLVCEKQFRRNYLREHMKIHANEKDYKCMICGKKYRWRTLLRNHKKTHLADNPFTCALCGLRMSSKFALQQHRLAVHAENQEKKFACTQCDKKYVTAHQLKAHEKIHAEDRGKQCEYCGKVYLHAASLERHRRLHRGEQVSDDYRFKCSTCSLICHSKTHYTAHCRIHTGEKPYNCETCGKSYRQVAQLNTHKIVHTDLRPFKCKLCTRTFRCRSNLDLHMDHHKGEKRHMCQYCGQKFFSYPNMLKHVRRNHLNLRPHQCPICEKSFCEKQELKNHSRVHTGEKKPPPKRKREPFKLPASEKGAQEDQQEAFDSSHELDSGDLAQNISVRCPPVLETLMNNGDN